MFSVRNLLALATLLFSTFALLACTPTSEEDDAAAVDAEAWSQVQQAKDQLEAKRQELRDLRARIAEDGEDGSDEAGDGGEGDGGENGEGDGGEGGEEALSPEQQLATLEQEVVKMTEDFTAQLADFINSQELYEGQELTEVQRAAFDMKAHEDILVAQEYIDKAGNYQKAIDIYTTSMLADPESEMLLEAKARAEELRFMTEERFAAAKNGMSQEEVRAALGTPQPVNVREYDRGVIAWFYPKEERGAAAGVFFRERRGKLEAYEADFNAITPEEEDEGEG